MKLFTPLKGIRRVATMAAVSLGLGVGAVALMTGAASASAPVAPNAPTNVTASVDVTGGVTVSWSVPNDNANGNPSLAIFDYYVYNAAGQLECNTANNTPNATSCLFHANDGAPRVGYAWNTPIQFYVVAHNVSGTNSPASALSNSVTPTIYPNAPYNVWVQYDYNNAHNMTGGDGYVYWSVPNNNGEPIVGYNVTFTPTGTPFGPYHSQTVFRSGANTTSSYFALLVHNQSYTVTVQAVNDWNNTATSNGVGTTAPWGNSAPSNVQAADNKNGSIHISWNSPGNNGTWSGYWYGCGFLNLGSCYNTNSQNTTSFSVWDTNGNFICTTSGTSCDTGVLNLNSVGKNTLGYAYVVYPNDNWVFGDSAVSNTAYPTIWPDSISSVNAYANNDGSVFISWPVPADNGNAIVSYQVYDDNNGLPVCEAASITVSNGTAYCTTARALSNAQNTAGLQVNTSVNFVVSSLNELGQGNGSATSNSVTPWIGPISPTAVNAVANNDGTVTISWTPAAQNAGAQISHYMAFASTDGTNWFPVCSVQSINGVTANECSTNNSGYTQLVPGVTYHFEAVAYNTSFNESDTNVANPLCPITGACAPENGTVLTTTATSAVRPDYATNVVATDNGNGTITLNWTAPASNDTHSLGYPVTQLGIFLMGEAPVPVQVADPSATSVTLPIAAFNGQYGSSYQFFIGATNGTWSMYDTLTNNPPSMPAGSQVSNNVVPTNVPDATSINSVTVNDDGSVTINWSPAMDNGSAVTGYTVYDSNNNVVCTSANVLTCTTGQLVSGQSYQFYIVATNANGNSANSALSTAVTAEITPTWTAVPTASKNADHSFTINWVAPNAYGANLTYTVYQVNAGGDLVVCHTTDLTCRTTTQSAVTGTQYTFYVVATNDYNNSATSSNTDPIGFVQAPVFAGAPKLAKNANKSFTISWTANTFGSTVTYVVKDVQSGATICTTTNSSCTLAANSAVAGVTYTYNVVATNADGNWAPSANVSGAFALVKPKAPVTVTVSFKESSAALSAAAKATLKTLAAKLAKGNHVVVTGHSSAGKSFSVARATAVANYLKSLKSGLVLQIVDGGASSAQMPSATVVVTW